MNKIAHKLNNLTRRKYRVRSRITGTAARPRLSIFVSNRHISAQLIDDTTHKTLTAISTVGSEEATGTLSSKAAWVGSQIAKQAKSAKVKSVVLDRNGKLYHGRVKALADAARAEGLEF